MQSMLVMLTCYRIVNRLCCLDEKPVFWPRLHSEHLVATKGNSSLFSQFSRKDRHRLSLWLMQCTAFRLSLRYPVIFVKNRIRLVPRTVTRRTSNRFVTRRVMESRICSVKIFAIIMWPAEVQPFLVAAPLHLRSVSILGSLVAERSQASRKEFRFVKLRRDDLARD